MRFRFDIKTPDLLVWRGWVVMSRTEEPFFERLFRVMASRGYESATVLEVGFGLGISAEMIQRHLAPKRHDIVEIDEAIAADLRRFSRKHPSVHGIRGSVWSFKPRRRYDLVFFDAFDYLDESDDPEDDGSLLHAARRFRRLLNPDGIVVCPEFGEVGPMTMPGYEMVSRKEFRVPPYYLHDGTMTTHGAVSCWRIDNQVEG